MSGNPVWVNGTLGGAIDPFDRGLTLGDGVFDTLVAFNRKPFASERHRTRLIAHAAAIGIAIDPAAIEAGWRAVIKGAEPEHLILRTTVTRGPAGRGLWPATPPAPTLMVSAAPWSAATVGRPVRLVTGSIARNAGSPTSRLKATGYLDSILAAREAAAKGADDALILNAAGRVACSTIANVFAISGNSLVTPPEADGVMAGILRGLVMEAAPAAGLEPEQRSLLPADLLAADAVFLTNSVRLVSPVAALDSHPLEPRAADRVAALLEAIAHDIHAGHGIDPRDG